MKIYKSFGDKIQFSLRLYRKITTGLLLLLFPILQAGAELTYSQMTTLSLSLKNSTIENALNQIERETEFSFLFLDKGLEIKKKINIRTEEESIDEVLNTLFENTNIQYKVMDRQIVLSRRPAPAPIPGHAQQDRRRIQGVVKDENGETIIGANVIEKGTTNGVTTDIDGRFSLEVGRNATLQVSYVGYTTLEVAVGNQTTLTIVLGENAELLDEVVVVAFSTMKKEAFTGSAGVMNASDLIKSQQINPAEALAGRVAGVQVSNTSGMFGSEPNITIRGFSSISSDTNPLIVLDGMPFDGSLEQINSADIESMTVLKDAASNALYGARGANGVIMITTKRGRSGAASVSFDAKWGWNTAAVKDYDYVKDPGQYYETYYRALYNKYIADGMTASEAHAQANNGVSSETAGVGPGYMVFTVPTGQDFINADGRINPAATLGRLISYEGQDYWLQPDSWSDEALRTGLRQEYVANISGATDRMNYYSSIGYLKSDGITPDSQMKRLTARLKADYQARSWLKVGANMSYTKTEYDGQADETIGSSGSIWSYKHAIAPIYPVYVRDGNKNIMRDQWGEIMYDFGTTAGLQRPSFAGSNPIFTNKYLIRNEDIVGITASGFADINFTNELKLTVNGSTNSSDRRYSSVRSPFVENYSTTQNNGTIAKSHSRTYSYNTQQLLNYTTSFNDDHNFTLLLGHEYYYYKYSYLYGYKTNMALEDATELNGALNSSGTESSYLSEYNNEGYFGRLMYDYQGKYYFSGSYRRDASSRFHPDHRWGNFWSVGGAWLIDKESWFNVDWINSLKFKASVGAQGNDNIGSYMYSDQYNIVNNLGEASFTFKQKGSETITWETNTNFNTGFEFDLFKGRLSGSIEYFYRKTTDMLFSVTVPPSIGYTSYYTNVGDMRNSGMEVDLNAVFIRNKNIYWDFNLNFSRVRNKILMLPSDVKTMNVEGYDGYTFDDSSFVSKYKYFIGEGLPLYTWYLPKYAGPDEEGLSSWYKDVLDDHGNVIGQETTTTYSEADSYLCGQAMPDLYGGFGTNISFYGFDFSANFTYQIGGKAYDYGYQTSMSVPSAAYGGNFHKDLWKAWTPENASSDIPRFQYGDLNQASRSDRFLTNASYLNVQNINFGYTVPRKLTQKWDVQTLRVYLSCENVAYVSARKGFDPRQSAMGYTNPQSYTPMRTISVGLNLTF